MVAQPGRLRSQPVRLGSAVFVDARAGDVSLEEAAARGALGALIPGASGARSADFMDRVQKAAAAFLPAFDGKINGRVLVGLPPCLACLADKIDGEVSDFYLEAKARNLMPEVPASDEGVKAARTLAAAGIPFAASGIINRKRADEFLEAYMNGLQDRVNKELDAGQAAMALHVPVGRIDAHLDPVLDERRRAAPIETIGAAYRVLIGRVGVSTAKMINRDLKRRLNSARWELLAAHQAVKPFCVFTFEPRSEDKKVELWGEGAASVVDYPGLASAVKAADGKALDDDLDDARFKLDKLANYQFDMDHVAANIEGGLSG